MANEYDYPLYNELIVLIQEHFKENPETHNAFAERAELDRSYVQQFHAGMLMPGLENADKLARGVEKKFILVDIHFDERSIQINNVNP